MTTTGTPVPADGRASRCDALRRLHAAGGPPLVLANAWDPLSAVLIAQDGAAAVATSSGAVAWANGRADGGALGVEAAVRAAARIVDAVAVPVTVDFENGYADSLDGLRSAVGRLAETGAAGLNLEDSDGRSYRLYSLSEAADRVAAARHAGGAGPQRMFLNARVDTYLLRPDVPDLLTETIARAKAYEDAGADGIFVPGVVDERTIRALARELATPLNVMAGPGAPDVATLGDWGARRISTGTRIMERAYALALDVARDIREVGTFDGLAGPGLDYFAVNECMRPR